MADVRAKGITKRLAGAMKIMSFDKRVEVDDGAGGKRPVFVGTFAFTPDPDISQLTVSGEVTGDLAVEAMRHWPTVKKD